VDPSFLVTSHLIITKSMEEVWM